MACKNFNKQDEKLLKAYASKMPKMIEYVTETHVMTGKQLREIGYAGKDEKDLVDDTKYLYKSPVIVPVNHYRRLKKARLNHGEAGLKKYFEEVKASIDTHKKNELEYAKQR